MQGGGGGPRTLSQTLDSPARGHQGNVQCVCLSLMVESGRSPVRAAHLSECSPVEVLTCQQFRPLGTWGRYSDTVLACLLVVILRKGLRRCYTPGLAKVHRFVSSSPALPTSPCRGGRARVGPLRRAVATHLPHVRL